MRTTRLVIALSLALAPAAAVAGPGDGATGSAAGSATASASVKVSIAADVSAPGKAYAAAGDKAYAAGDMEAALAAYGQGFATTRDTAFVYAMARAHEAAGHKAEAQSMFQMYLNASNQASLKYKGEAQGAVGAGAQAGAGVKADAKAALGSVAGLGSKAVGAAKGAVADVGAGVYGAVKLSIAGSMSGAAKAKAKTADTAYAAGNYEAASKGYLEAYAAQQQPVALYAAAQAKAQAGDAVTARVLLQGYVTAQPKGTYAKDANTLLLALGGSANASATANIKTGVTAGDTAFKAGKYLDAAKAYGDAQAKAGATAASSTVIYAKAMAELYAGNVAEARKDLQAYLSASGNLEFKVQAQATLRATGSGSATAG